MNLKTINGGEKSCVVLNLSHYTNKILTINNKNFKASQHQYLEELIPLG